MLLDADLNLFIALSLDSQKVEKKLITFAKVAWEINKGNRRINCWRESFPNDYGAIIRKLKSFGKK